MYIRYGHFYKIYQYSVDANLDVPITMLFCVMNPHQRCSQAKVKKTNRMSRNRLSQGQDLSKSLKKKGISNYFQ